MIDQRQLRHQIVARGSLGGAFGAGPWSGTGAVALSRPAHLSRQLAVNQTTMAALSMIIIASIIGGCGGPIRQKGSWLQCLDMPQKSAKHPIWRRLLLA